MTPVQSASMTDHDGSIGMADICGSGEEKWRGGSPEKVQDCLESDLSQFILEKEGPERQFRFEGMYMNILPIISLFDFK